MSKSGLHQARSKQHKQPIPKQVDFLTYHFGLDSKPASKKSSSNLNSKKKLSTKKKQQPKFMPQSPKSSIAKVDLFDRNLFTRSIPYVREFKSKEPNPYTYKETDRGGQIDAKPKKQSKININFEIKNVNIYKAVSPPAKRGHKKTATGLDYAPYNQLGNNSSKFPEGSKKNINFGSPKHANMNINVPMTPSTKHKNNNPDSKKAPASAGATKTNPAHRKAKSQDLINSKTFAVEKFIIGNPQDDEDQAAVAKYSVRSRPGTMDGKPKINQDSYISLPTFLHSRISLFAVCDGHGINGHYVSDFVKELLPENIQYYSIKNKLLSRDTIAHTNMEKSQTIIQEVMRASFKKTTNDLYASEIDTTFSGSTAVVCLIVDNFIYCANIGDSRCVVYSQEKDQPWVCTPLSVDHKADIETEAKRILDSNGRLEPYRDQQGNQMGPYRVWLSSDQIPGLAMTRSFGDYVASTVGVISEPETIAYPIKYSNIPYLNNAIFDPVEDKFMILASDGLWEFISNEEALKIVTPCFMRNDPEEAARLLEKRAIEIWKEEDEIIDDITIIVLFFKNY